MAFHPSSATRIVPPTLKSKELTVAGMTAASLLLFFCSNTIVAWVNQFIPVHTWPRNYSVPIATFIYLTATIFIHKRKKISHPSWH